MPKRDFLFGLCVSILAGIFLVPTLINTGYYSKLPFVPVLLFVVLPVLAAFGMFVAYFIGKKTAILWQFAKFAMVGVLNTAIDFGILNLLILTTDVTRGVGIIPLNISSYSIALLNSYFWNKKWVFGTTKGNFLTFVVITLIGLGINTGIVFVITTFVDPIFVSDKTLWANIAKVLATAISLFWNFAGYRLIVFGKSRKI